MHYWGLNISIDVIFCGTLYKVVQAPTESGHGKSLPAL